MVECKYSGNKKTVGIEEINKFAGVVAVARNIGAVDKGLCVTTHGYTAAAKLNAHSAGIELTTYRELSTQLVDFDDYIEKVIGEFESSPVSKYYIDLSGTELEDYEGEDASIFHRPIDDYINRQFDDGRGKLALLGNFGTGKSTFCRKYAHDLALRYRNDQMSRIPIVVNLSDYDSKLHIQQLILNTLQFRYNVNITSTVCQELQRIGRFILLLDGFDEMATRVDSDTIRENLREINKISEISENKFILTCRTHFFRDRVQAEVLANFEILYIPEWREPELREYLQKRLGSEWEEQLERIVGTHNLPELAQTALFLEMIVETLPRLGAEVKRIELYEAYTNKWIKDQSGRKGARLSALQRTQFVEELALKLYTDNRLSCHHKEFVSMLRQWFEIDDAAQMDYFRSDVQTCTFLTRDSDGNYKFRHQSFMEFFVAKALAADIQAGSQKRLGAMLLPLEVRSFLIDFLIDNPPANRLKDWLQNTQEQTLRDNILSILPRLKISLGEFRLESPPDQENLRTADEDLRIATEFLRGDVRSFDVLYSRFRKPLMKYIQRINRLPYLDEDILIDTFLTAWRYRDRLSSVTALRPFLYKVAQNKCIDIYRRESKYRNDLTLDDIADSTLLSDEVIAPSPEAAFINFSALADALKLLPDKEQMVILGTMVEGKSFEEVGRELHIASDEVRRARRRGIGKLRRLLKA